ncbi:dUTP pyrophosphatase [Brevundimonas phage vB_BpoS-Kikimora]|uniref:dUTP diphosphatase n=1 Tax=Brevundimonas phage vB_BpoS-Kikimora TaxID=2948601 RepID=A0A9E7MS56_9CAUD|nr:dUTP pyrophosphatase [Brevundimonas phage vB_BpoS-Kikimora]
MSVLIHYSRATQHEAADALRRLFSAAGFENVQVAFNTFEGVDMPSGVRLSFSEARQFLHGIENAVPIEYVTLPHGEGLPMPAYESEQAAGMDLRAALDTTILIEPGRAALVPTGFNVAVPAGYELQVRSRSGLAAKRSVFVMNAPGTIDADYRGEIKVILHNAGAEPFLVERGDRIAQAVVSPVVQGRWVSVKTLSATQRGVGGFGSTGVG